jgi:hypothetical protein
MKGCVEVIESRMDDLIQYAYIVTSRPKEISYERSYKGIDIREVDFHAKRNDIRFGASARTYYDRHNMPLAGWSSDGMTWFKLLERINHDCHFENAKRVIRGWVLEMNEKHEELCRKENQYKLLLEAPVNKKVLRKKRNLAI